MLIGCSDAGGELAAPSTAATVASTSLPATVSPDSAAASTSAVATEPPSTPPTDEPPGDPEPLEPTTTIVDVAEVGVPGLDSDDAFCAAWSRFGGSWQVLLVASVFGGDEAAVSELEVVAAPLVATSYEALVASFPDELAAEADVAAEDYFGLFARRSAEALESLRDAGASDDQLAELAAAWIDALAGRDPAQPIVDVGVPDELAALVADAATRFRTRRIGMADDPSMVVAAETPATDRYLETSCPDQGALAGQEVPDGG